MKSKRFSSYDIKPPLCKCGYRSKLYNSSFCCYSNDCDFFIREEKFLENKNLINVQSNAEFSFLNGTKKYVKNLDKFFCAQLSKYPGKNREIRDIYCNCDLYDDEIYNGIKNVLYNKGKKYAQQEEHGDFRNTFRNSAIQKILPKSFLPKNILDYGCGDGKITSFMGEQFKVSKENIFGCDVKDVKNDGITFLKVSENTIKLPFEDNSIDFIISLMCLHHVKKVDETIAEFYRIINKKSGIIVIREHDKIDDDFSVFLDVVHGLYCLVFSNPPENPNWTKEYFAKYESRRTWKRKFEKNNFVLMDQSRTIGIYQSFYYSFIPDNKENIFYNQRIRTGNKRSYSGSNYQKSTQRKRGKYNN